MMILEFSHLQNPLMKQVYDKFSFEVIPKIGKVVTNDEESYQYLVESIRRFPKQVYTTPFFSLNLNSFYIVLSIYRTIC